MNVSATNWNKISHLFKGGSLILGNGSSIAIDNCFIYESLYKEALKKTHIKKLESDIFTQFSTNNFEAILKHLARSAAICKILNEMSAHANILNKYQSIREALYKTVLDTHPNVPNKTAFDNFVLKVKFENKILFLQDFRTIINLNYDILLYWMTIWAMKSYSESLISRTTSRYSVIFKDCFTIKDIPNERLLMAPNPDELRENISGDSREVSLIFYPHGNLVLANEIDEDLPIKIMAEYNLLETVNSKWASGKVTPLIICEGETKEKLKSIESNPYTSMVYHYVLPNLQHGNQSKNVTILGWSLDKNDQHILR